MAPTSSGIEALASLQREFAHLVSALAPEPCASPGGGETGLRGWLRGDRSTPAGERVRIYANAYFTRIHDALRSDYGALHAVLGEAAFRDLARLYLMAHPSRSFSLRFVGARLPAFLAGPIAEAFQRRWPFAPELAALDWALTDVFDAPDAPLLSREQLAAQPAEAWERLRFGLITAWRLLRFSWPVQQLRAAWDSGLDMPQLEPATTWVLVCRRGEEVRYREVSDVESYALRSVQAGDEFGSTCARIAQTIGAAEAPRRALEMLERWLADGLLARLWI
jgi:hypothetical protein